MLRVWIAERKLHCSMKVGMYRETMKIPEEKAWGVILADVARHVACGLAPLRRRAQPDPLVPLNKTAFSLGAWCIQFSQKAIADFFKRLCRICRMVGPFEHLFEQRGVRNRPGLIPFSSGRFIPRRCRGRHTPVVRCTPAALHLRPSSSIVRAFSRRHPAYYAVC
jgi:hypothetical protein